MDEPTNQKQRKLDRVLIIHEDPAFVQPIRDALSPQNIDVLAAAGFEAVTAKLEQETFSLIISEISMVAGSGNPLLRWIHTQLPEAKVLLITDFADVPLAQITVDLGCENFLPRPFTSADILQAVKDTVTPVDSYELSDVDYARIAIEDFIYGKNLPYEIYVRLRNHKYVKIARAGQNIDLDLIESYKAKGLQELWISKSNFTQYLELSQKAAQLAIRKTDFGDLQRSRLIKHACEIATENLRMMGINEGTMKIARQTLVSALSLMTTNSGALTLISDMEKHGPASYSHSVTCGILCGLLAKVMGWYSEKNVISLTLGGYLHDIGLDLLPLENHMIDPECMSDTQRAIYEQHPKLGADALRRLPNIPDEVVKVVLQHHENNRGTGFPDKLTRPEIFPLAKIVGLVDQFCDRVLRLDPQLRSSAPQALRDLVAENPSFFEENAVIALTILLTEPDQKRARLGFESAVNRKSA